jgi:Histidine kinase-, DNA gyrase B-, and HSP90-like ATPase/HAMP domain
MLRRLRIGTRVNMLIVLPLAALVALAAGAVWSAQRVGLGSAEYERLELIDDLRSTVSQPTASLLPAWAKINEVAALRLGPSADDADTRARIEDLLQEIETLRATQSDVLAYWEQQNLDKVTQDVMTMSSATGSSFWTLYDAEFTPALRGKDVGDVADALTKLQSAFGEESLVTERISRLVDSERDDQSSKIQLFVERLQIVLIAAVSALVMITVLLAFMVRRSIVRPIKSLASHATDVADQSLPSAVRQASEGEQPKLEMFKTEKGGELADLGRSFNSMQEVALELAVDQARARQNVSDNLVNIARRNQSLLGRTLSLITELEQNERDADRLEHLFGLDHLATRMRRNAQSLLVLADAEPTRRFAPPSPIGDVVRAALSEVERYAQVDLGDLGEGFMQGALVPEVAHLLAELIENATSFSPPNSQVSIVGRSVADGHQLVIIDYGLGMSAEELSSANARLARVSAFEQESSRMLGFHVISRLAARHGIKVMLTATPGGRGTTAIVRLPAAVMDAQAAATIIATSQMPAMPAAAPTAPPAAPPAALPPTAPAPPPATHQLPQPPVHMPMSDIPVPAVLPTRTPGAMRIDNPSIPAEQPTWAPTSLTGDRPPMSAEEIREVVEGSVAHIAAEQHVVAAESPTLPTVTNSGLSRRVKGAQLPDLGVGGAQELIERPAEHVRSSLSNLQRGVGLGRLSASGENVEYQGEEER